MTSYLEVDELAAGLQAHLALNSAATSKDKVTQKKTLTKKETTSADGCYDRWTLKDSVDYGPLGPSSSSSSEERFYLTTAINYTNGPAHMGHAYEAATSDVIARHARLSQRTVFCTGADEHGQKIATTASDAGKEPLDICNHYVTGFQVLNQRLLISNNDYVRTTSDRHKDTARRLWQKCAENGDIYLDKYSGWYNVREETFVTDKEAELAEFKDVASGLPLKKVEEESYFFRMSKYQKRLIEHIQNNPKFIQPDKHRKQILARLEQDELRDLSISRTTFSWGISVPQGFDANHVMYVWMDALSNYLTGVDYFETQGRKLADFWPANVHIIGKDILWFHTVIWPCLLFSAGIPLPKQVFAHGFVNDREGKKMSKSLGNVIDPHDMLDKYSVDTFRWYLCKEAPYGGELSFSEESLTDMHNADLCDTLGNLVHRATNLCHKYCGGSVPEVAPHSPLDLGKVVETYQAKMTDLDLQGGANVVIGAFRDVNGYLQEEAPWLKKGDEHAEARQVTVRTCLECIYVLTHMLLSFMPSCCRIFEKLGTPPVAVFSTLQLDQPNLKVGTPIVVGEVLFTKILSEAEKAAAGKKGKGGGKESFAEAQARKKAAKAKQIANSKTANAASGIDPNQPDFTKMEIRVGKIVKVWNHPDADKLFCEEIDVGEESGPREIASGLRAHYSLEDMQDKMVLVVCNMKPSKMLGFLSSGMVLAAKTDDKVELVSPPEGAQVGERIFVEGLSGEPISAAQVKKRKVWEAVCKDLQTGSGGVALYKDQPLQSKAGPCKAPSLEGAPIA